MIKKTKSSFRIKFRLFNKIYTAGIYKIPQRVTIGISNITPDRYYVPFVDYDNINYNSVLAEANKLISMFNLTGLAIIKTKETTAPNMQLYGNYHLVGIDKLTYQQHIKLLEQTNCDPSFIIIPKIYRGRYWVLRIYPKISMSEWNETDGKPVLADWIYGHKSKYQHSTAHYSFLNMFYKTPNIILNGDSNTQLKLVRYIT